MERAAPLCFFDPGSPRIRRAGIPSFLVELGLLREGSLAECELVYCDKARHPHFSRLREEQGLGFRLNHVPEASNRLHRKQAFSRLLADRPYLPKTHLESCLRPLRGVWVEKPFNLDWGRGIRFLRSPWGWRKPQHLLQRYVEDPWLVGGKKAGVRVVARVDDDGGVRVHREGLVQVAGKPFSLEDLDPRIHNTNVNFQQRTGSEEVETHLLSETAPDGTVDELVAVVRDTVAILEKQGRLRGSRDFEMIGYDFVVDRHGEPHLLEANRMPGFHLEPVNRGRFYRGAAHALFGDL